MDFFQGLSVPQANGKTNLKQTLQHLICTYCQDTISY